MASTSGVEIESVQPGSLAEHAGLREGDVIVSMNGSPVRDVIDFMFHRATEELDIEYRRKTAADHVKIITDDEVDLGITLKPFKVKTCKNSCVFCFVKQLPKGLRRPLYVKDEDYRLSFLYGNYITLSNLSPADKKRIVSQRLSPLYISVHSTDKAVRNRMLGNLKAENILRELRFFADNKIRMHIQVVLCPGFNDGRELKNTVSDLYKLFPYVSSIAVVPVGLTRHRTPGLRPVGKEDAGEAIDIVEAFQKRFRKRHGDPVVFCSDEMYIKAERQFPPLRDYGSLPQIENGVGLVPLFLSQAKKLKTPKSIQGRGRRFLTFTGVSFYPFLKKLIDRLAEKEQIDIEVVPVVNEFFGPSVTVTGLLTGRDVIRSLHDIAEAFDVLLVPGVVLKEGEGIFLDDVSIADVEEALGLKIMVTDCSPQGLIETIAGIP